MNVKFIKINNMKSEYIVKGRGIDVLFIHGGSVSFRSYLPFIEELVNDAKVWALSLPGAGKAAKLSKNWTIDNYADIIYKFSNKFNIKPILASHSLGGMISVKAKAKYPRRFRELILMAPAGLCYEKPGNAVLEVLKDKIRILFAKGIGSKEMRGDLFINLFYHFIDMSRISKIFSGFDVEEDIVKISDKVILFWGKYDKIFTDKYRQKFESKLRRSTSYILEGPHGFINKNRCEICKIIRREILDYE